MAKLCASGKRKVLAPSRSSDLKERVERGEKESVFLGGQDVFLVGI